MVEMLAVFIFGLIIGSFSNVVIYRLPSGNSIIFPSSHCRSCFAPIHPLDNIPLFSYLLLRGRCRYCRESISLRYLGVESLSGVLYVVLWYKFGLNFQLLVYALLISSLLMIAVIDFDHKIIPNSITLPGILTGLGLSFWALPIAPLDSLIGLFAGGIFFYLVALISKGGMGGGDIKLIAMIGAFLGWQGVFFTILVGALAGSVVGLSLMSLGKKGRKDKVPFGPFLALGAILYILAGDYLISWYLQLLA